VTASPSNGEQDRQRLDKWLWHARQFRTRSLAARFVEEHTVRVTRNGVTQRVDKPSFLVMAGDEIAFGLDRRVIALRVLAFDERRRGAADAQRLYE
jgi:ribosome-associated heat shock protein Hsp15